LDTTAFAVVRASHGANERDADVRAEWMR
jgi:hypothetical protein